MPSAAECRVAVERYYELWNANDRAGWLQHMRAVAPGEPTIEDPVGKPLKRGWEMFEELWDRTTTKGEHFPVSLDRLYVCGLEVAAVCRCDGTFRGASYSIPSVDVHQFHGDSWTVRSYWDIAAMRDLPYGQWTSATGEPVDL
jgi:hypothetical protein